MAENEQCLPETEAQDGLKFDVEGDEDQNDAEVKDLYGVDEGTNRIEARPLTETNSDTISAPDRESEEQDDKQYF